MNNLFQRLQPLDFVLIAALFIVGALLVFNREDGSGTTLPAVDDETIADWQNNISVLLVAFEAESLSRTRAAMEDAATTARNAGDALSADAIDRFSDALTGFDFAEVETAFNAATADQVGPFFTDLYFTLTFALTLRPLPESAPPAGDAWGEIVLRGGEDAIPERHNATVSWSISGESDAVAIGTLTAIDTDFAAELRVDYAADPALLTLRWFSLPTDGMITNVSEFWTISYSDLVDNRSGPLGPSGTMSTRGNNAITMELDEDALAESVRTIAEAREIGALIVFADGHSATIRFQTGTAGRDILGQIANRWRAE